MFEKEPVLVRRELGKLELESRSLTVGAKADQCYFLHLHITLLTNRGKSPLVFAERDPTNNAKHKSMTMAKTILEDDGSSSSVATTFDIDNMTEEEAMAIWLKRNEEIGERVRRREAAETARRAQKQQLSSSSSSSFSVGGGSSSSPSCAAVDCDESLHTHFSDSVGSGDMSSGCFQHAAAVTHSDAWKRAISRNVMGEYDPQNTDPAYQNAYHAYQRFVDMNQPGMADNFVASTPGLAALMEQRRHLMAKQRCLDLQVEEMDHQMHTSHNISSSSQANSVFTVQASPSSVPAPQDQGDQSLRKSPLHLSSRSADDVTKAKNGLFSMTRLQGRHSSSPLRLSRNTAPENNPTHVVSAATSAQILEYRRLQQAHSSHLKFEESHAPKVTTPTNSQPSYFYAFPYRTQYNPRAVMCSSCQSCVYTTPLAENMFCQSCGQISKVVQGDLESRCEGKMQEAEDMDVGY